MLALLLFAGALLPGCGDSNALLRVQAFVVTKGRENIRLGLLTVHAAPLSSVEDILGRHVVEAQTTEAMLRKELHALHEQRVARQDAVSNGNQEIKALRKELAEQERLSSEIESSITGDSLSESPISEATRRLSTHISHLSDEAILRAKDHRAKGRPAEADAEYSKAMSLNDVVKNIWLLMEKRREGRTPADKMHQELITFYSGEHFKQCDEERKAVLDALADMRKLERMQRESQQAVDNMRATLAKLTDKQKDLEGSLAEVSSQIEQLNKKRDDLWSQDTLFAALPSPRVSKQTDPEGLVMLELDRRTDWVIWAHADRQTLSGIEEYGWIVKVPPASSWNDNEPLFLSNDNLLETPVVPPFIRN